MLEGSLSKNDQERSDHLAIYPQDIQALGGVNGIQRKFICSIKKKLGKEIINWLRTGSFVRLQVW